MNSKFEDSRSAGPRPSRSDSNPSDCHLPARDFSNLLNPQIPSSPDSASEHVHNNSEQAADKHAASSSHHNPAVVDNRPKRKRITQEQLVDLLAMFEQTNTPSFEVREQLANKLNMTNREVQVWFQNRRAKVNRAQLQQAPRFYHHGGSGMIAPHHVNLYPHPYHFVALNQTEPVVMHESMSNPSQSSRHPHHSDANMGMKFNPPSTFSSRSYRRGNTFIPAPIKVTPYTIPGTHAHTNPNPAHSPPILSPSDPSNHRISHSARTVSFSSALPSPLDSAGLSSLPSLFRDSLNIQSPTTPISAMSDLRTPNSANTRPIVSPLNTQFSKALPSPSTHAYSHPIESPSSSHFNIPSSAKLNPLPSIKELGLDRLS
ncbi:hypothetical protein CONCODRAFT_78748 [Conidiobolus coronatus NRRL 28638]|uniref:Homeobox domain-containing protein n=1 Tax=Conidiobolus coronatus (strain ATCC 28846 / CBS 209.66 / NRRL 28638) TaxID=796925 RepID=A0A137P6J8_CONC2|nr:hypothetical protein CONCODRAFT_78748 [Conidiobolus coronatus NRRL 28638]|eukprot:KXN70628.1 hypothetical protein CONCODRAFT_78748 [Conidiobolus coronatus NRRL 28638]